MLNFTTLPPLSLYVHIPWCVRKCPYCDFNSHTAPEVLPEQAYVRALLADLEQELPAVWGRKVISVFLGGGTPSLFSPQAIDQLLSGLRARLNLQADVEITLEANPGTVDVQRFADFRAAGINRLSIGVQSFDARLLEKIGRIHDDRQAIRAAEAAHKAGFDNFNLDLMFGLPEQSRAQSEHDVRTAIDLEPAHISFYQLTLEPNTYFHAHPPELPDDDRIEDLQERGQALLAEAGYAQYEVSAYARANRRCRHNLNYWQYGDYLGIGAGAHGKITLAQAGEIRRRWKKRHPNDYLSGVDRNEFIGGDSAVPRREIGFEFMLNALRLTDGFATTLFAGHAGQPISVIAEALARAEELELLHWDAQTIRPTERGRRYLNNLVELFLPPDTGKTKKSAAQVMHHHPS